MSSSAATRSRVTDACFIEADRDRLFGAVGSSAHLAGPDHPFGEDRRLLRRLCFGVEELQGEQGREVRVRAEPSEFGVPASDDGLAGLGVRSSCLVGC